jgi:ribosomal protein S12
MAVRVTTTKIKDNKKNNSAEREDIRVKIFFNDVEVTCYMNCRILRTETLKFKWSDITNKSQKISVI